MMPFSILKNRLVLVCASLSVLVLSNIAAAAVVTGDWKNPGDGLLTRDLDNGLEWLDLQQTMAATDNRTYLDVSSELGPGGEFAGFRYASEAELLALWESAGIPNIDSGGTNANFDPVSDLISLMDNTSDNSINLFSYGILSESNSAGTHIAAGIDITSPTTGRARTFVVDVADDQTDLNGGHFLVRAVAVPEPSSIFALTLLGLASIHRRTRKRR